MNATLRTLTLLALFGATACSNESALFKDNDMSGATSDTADDEETPTLTALRLDVYPSAASGGIVAQTKTVALNALDGEDIDLEAPVTLRGTVTGYEATPPSAVEVPGEDTPVVAEVRLDQQSGIADAGTTSDADGDFRLQATPSDDYVFSVVPVEPANLPFLVLSGLTVTDGLDLSKDALDLGYGQPVYGTVARSDGTPVNADVTLIDLETGVRGPSVETDPTGYYQLRALPGTYALEVLGQGPQAVPTVLSEVEVAEGEGSNLDIDMGDYEAVAFEAQVVDATGDGLSDVTVRFSSNALADPNWSLERETKTDDRGNVITRLLPGSWHIEIIPDYSEKLSPVSLDVDVGVDDLTLQAPIEVPGLSLLSSLILDPQGAPMSGVVVAVTESGFNGRTWTGVTDAAGRISLEVPEVAVALCLTPPDDSAAITRINLSAPSDLDDTVYLGVGTPIRGRLVVDGQDVPFALVELRDPTSGTLLGSTITASDGSFAVHLDL